MNRYVGMLVNPVFGVSVVGIDPFSKKNTHQNPEEDSG